MLLRYTPIFKASSFYRPFHITLSPQQLLLQNCKLATLVSTYRQYGHYFAALDPLSIYNRTDREFIKPSDLQLSSSQPISSFNFSSPITSSSQTIQQLQPKLREAYLGSTGVQFDHIADPLEREWLYSTYQSIKLANVPDAIKIEMAKTLIESEALDHFLQKKLNNFKRFSGEGGEGAIVALNQIFRQCSQADYEYVVFGVTHRGRFNVLADLLQFQRKHLLRTIADRASTPPELRNVNDDVVQLLALSMTKQYKDKKINLSLVHHPAHLEFQYPVALGKTRSKINTIGKEKVLGVHVHGDAAVCGEGIVAESLCLSNTPNFSVGGSIHIIRNNQIGYTTKPIDSRPSKYATDLFKAYDIPIIHLNGESILDVHHAVSLAVRYRSQYKKDIVLDIYCYRRYGHNELDDPQFTQPYMYSIIKKNHESFIQKYLNQLISDKLISPTLYQQIRTEQLSLLETDFASHNDVSIDLNSYSSPQAENIPSAFTKQWKGLKPSQFGSQLPTSLPIPLLRQFAEASCYVPQDFNIHPRIKKFHMDKRLKSIQDNKLDWATCQALAFFTLNSEGYNIRLTGQDVERGTFSQRHLNLTDQKNQSAFNPLQFFASQQPGRGSVEILNSALSENAVIAFQYGFSIDNPNNFSIWEAQFGDFFNTAQVAIDTMMTNSQNKWMRQSSLTLILPHGFDGAGPEHSSCRIERFLQLANSDGALSCLSKRQKDNGEKLKFRENHFVENIYDSNFSVVAPSTPANLFHVLRRQMKRNFRKPLVVVGPKTLLRHPSCISTFEDLGPNTAFKPILKYVNADHIQDCSTLFLTSGKFVYDIQNLIQEKKSTKTCLLAIEELFPFPEELLESYLRDLSPDCTDCRVFWIQEQNFNGGPFKFVENRVNRVLRGVGIKNEVKYVGRRAVAATCVGSVQLHKQQSQQLNCWISDLIS